MSGKSSCFNGCNEQESKQFFCYRKCQLQKVARNVASPKSLCCLNRCKCLPDPVHFNTFERASCLLVPFSPAINGFRAGFWIRFNKHLLCTYACKPCYDHSRNLMHSKLDHGSVTCCRNMIDDGRVFRGDPN